MIQTIFVSIACAVALLSGGQAFAQESDSIQYTVATTTVSSTTIAKEESAHASTTVQEEQDDPFSIDFISTFLFLGDKDPVDIALSLIRVALGFLAIVFLVIVLKAGFLWMVSGGDEQKHTAAKKSLWNALIGVLIILSANAIVQFVFGALVKNVGTNDF